MFAAIPAALLSVAACGDDDGSSGSTPNTGGSGGDGGAAGSGGSSGSSGSSGSGGTVGSGGAGDGGTSGSGGASGAGGSAGSGGSPGDAGGPTEFTVTIENTSPVYEFTASGVVNTPVGADDPAPIAGGESYEFKFFAHRGQRLSFATMFVRSNDFFYSPDEDGIALFDEDGDPITGDVSDQIMIWDAGTEINEMTPDGLGDGPSARPQQPADEFDYGDDDPDDTVRLASGYDELPDPTEVIQVELDAEMVSGAYQFTVTITNASSASGSFQTPMSPGVWVVYTPAEGSTDGPLFTSGEPDRGNGLEDIAEDGVASVLGDYVAERTGLTTAVSPGVWAVHTMPNPFFESGMPDRGDGLEAIAEDGSPGDLAMALEDQMGIASSGAITTPMGASDPAPLMPGDKYEFTIMAMPGDELSIANMFVPSNDILFSNGMGIALWDEDAMPISGDITENFALWDAGTEMNQPPGNGLDQVQLQSGSNVGPADDDDEVRPLSDDFTYPDIADIYKVTIEPKE